MYGQQGYASGRAGLYICVQSLVIKTASLELSLKSKMSSKVYHVMLKMNCIFQ